MELERELVQKSIWSTFTGCQKIVKFTIMTLSWMLLLPSASKALLNTLEVICACKILDILFWLGIFEHYQQTNVDDKLFLHLHLVFSKLLSLRTIRCISKFKFRNQRQHQKFYHLDQEYPNMRRAGQRCFKLLALIGSPQLL